MPKQWDIWHKATSREDSFNIFPAWRHEWYLRHSGHTCMLQLHSQSSCGLHNSGLLESRQPLPSTPKGSRSFAQALQPWQRVKNPMFIFLLCKKFGQARLVWSQRIHIQRLHQKCQLRRYKHQPYAQPLCSSSHPRMDVAHRHIKHEDCLHVRKTPAWHCEFAPISIPFSPRCSSQTPRAKTPLEVASVERDSSKHLQALHGGCTRRIEAALAVLGGDLSSIPPVWQLRASIVWKFGGVGPSALATLLEKRGSPQASPNTVPR